MSWFSQCALMKQPKQWKLLLLILESGKSRFKGSTVEAPFKASSLGVQISAVSLCAHVTFLRELWTLSIRISVSLSTSHLYDLT